MIEDALAYHVANDATLTPSLGNRFYPNQAPQKAQMPYGIYQRIDTIRESHLRGYTGLAHPRFQIDWYGRDYDQLRTIADLARLTLQARRNFDMGPSGQTVNVRNIDFVDESHDALPPVDGTEKGIRHIRQDIIVWHTESVPAYQ